MTELEELKRRVDELQDAVIALSCGGPVTYNQQGHLIAIPRDNIPCQPEYRTADGRMPGVDRLWCPRHLFDCPKIKEHQR